MTTQETFNPVDYGFRWVKLSNAPRTGNGRVSWDSEGWYEYDGKIAEDAARDARDDRVRELKAAGHIVRKMRPVKSLITQGGIGTSHPQIELMVPVYSLLIVA